LGKRQISPIFALEKRQIDLRFRIMASKRTRKKHDKEEQGGYLRIIKIKIFPQNTLNIFLHYKSPYPFLLKTPRIFTKFSPDF